MPENEPPAPQRHEATKRLYLYQAMFGQLFISREFIFRLCFRSLETDLVDSWSLASCTALNFRYWFWCFAQPAGKTLTYPGPVCIIDTYCSGESITPIKPPIEQLGSAEFTASGYDRG